MGKAIYFGLLWIVIVVEYGNGFTDAISFRTALKGRFEGKCLPVLCIELNKWAVGARASYC
jgi:hypothetical protein